MLGLADRIRELVASGTELRMRWVLLMEAEPVRHAVKPVFCLAQCLEVFIPPVFGMGGGFRLRHSSLAGLEDGCIKGRNLLVKLNLRPDLLRRR